MDFGVNPAIAHVVGKRLGGILHALVGYRTHTVQQMLKYFALLAFINNIKLLFIRFGKNGILLFSRNMRLFHLLIAFFTFPCHPAYRAHIIFRRSCSGEGAFSLGDVAVAAASGGIGIVSGPDGPLLAGIEPHHAALVIGRGGLPALHRLGNVGLRVFAPADLDCRAAAVPPVGRHEAIPERRRGRERDPVKGRVLRAHLVVTRSAILEVVAVAVGLYLLPSGSRLRGGDGEVVLDAESEFFAPSPLLILTSNSMDFATRIRLFV